MMNYNRKLLLKIIAVAALLSNISYGVTMLSPNTGYRTTNLHQRYEFNLNLIGNKQAGQKLSYVIYDEKGNIITPVTPIESSMTKIVIDDNIDKIPEKRNGQWVISNKEADSKGLKYKMVLYGTRYKDYSIAIPLFMELKAKDIYHKTEVHEHHSSKFIYEEWDGGVYGTIDYKFVAYNTSSDFVKIEIVPDDAFKRAAYKHCQWPDCPQLFPEETMNLIIKVDIKLPYTQENFVSTRSKPLPEVWEETMKLKYNHVEAD